MANTPTTVLKEWQFLTDHPVTIDPAFWTYWEVNWRPSFNNLFNIVKKNENTCMCISDAQELNLLIKRLHYFLEPIRIENRFALDKTVKSLISHHLYNDMHIIGFIADVSGSDPEPISSDNVEKIKKVITSMADFWDRLRKNSK